MAVFWLTVLTLLSKLLNVAMDAGTVSSTECTSNTLCDSELTCAFCRPLAGKKESLVRTGQTQYAWSAY